MKRVILGLAAVLGLASLPGVLVIVESLNETGVEKNLRGCVADGPCLDPPQNSPVFRLSRNTTELCLTGTNLGEGGSFLLNGKPVEATQWPADFPFACLRVDPSEGSGMIALVRNDGARSNYVPFSAPPEIREWEIPSEIYPGTPLYVHGVNLRQSALVSQAAQEVQRDDDRIEFYMHTPGIHQVWLDGLEENGQEIRVTPRIERTCEAGPNTRCTLIVSPMGRDPLVSVLVAGQEAQVFEAAGSKIEFEWPDGLETGEHGVVVDVNGMSANASVHKLEFDRDTLLDFSPSAGFIGPRASPPPLYDGHLAQTYFTHLTGSEGPQYGFNVLGRVPLDHDLRRVTSEGEFGYEQYLNLGDELNTSQAPFTFAHDGRLFLLGKSATQNILNIVEYSAGTDSAWSRSTTSHGDFFSFSRIAAARFFGQTMVRIQGQTYSESARNAAFHNATIDAQDALRLEELFLDTSVGWMNADAAFITTCGAPFAPAGLMRLDISEQNGEVQISSPFTVLDGQTPDVHLLACSGTEEGLYWVERRGGSDWLVYLENQASEPETLAELPALAPGVGDRFDLPREFESNPERWLPGLLNMRVLDSGDVLFLHGIRDSEAPGVALMTWSPSTGFSEVEIHPVSMNAVAGEVCQGPWPTNDRETCGELGQFGCNPMACDQRNAVPISNENFQPWEADFWSDGSRVHVFLTVARTGQLDFAPFNRYELQHLKFSLPQ